MGVKVTGPIAACVVGTQSTVFYVNSENFLVTLANETENDQEVVHTSTTMRDNYDSKGLKVNQQSVKSATKDIAAVSFPMLGPNNEKIIRSRIYYINETGCLSELSKDGNASWSHGKLKDQKFLAMKNTPITATVSEFSDTIKVYYYTQDADQKAPWVAWYNGKTGAWKTDFLVVDK